MKVLIAAASFSPNISGVQRHALNVARCLLHQPQVTAVHLVLASWQAGFVRTAGLHTEPRLETHIADMERSALSRNLWHYRRLPSLASQVKADIVHLSYPAPVNASAFACPIVVTLHDLYPYEIPSNFGFPQVIVNRLILRQCLRSAHTVVCVSDTTRMRLRQYALAGAQKKALTIYNCAEPPPLVSLASPIPGLADHPFLLCIAQHRRNKNIPLVISAFNRLLQHDQIAANMQLAIVGIKGPETENIHKLVSRCGLRERVHFLEGLSEPDLQWCYARCELLVAPSITEGFGLPVVEALLAGCRVLCSDIPAFREVADERCRFVSLNGDAEKSLAEAIVASLHEPANPPCQFPQFSEHSLAEQYVNLYRSLLAPEMNTETAQYAATLSERQPS